MTAVNPLSKLFPSPSDGRRRVVILDGGLGTTLQAPPFSLGLNSALWSSELLATTSGRDQLSKLHHTWIDCGSDVLGSCTYQSALPLFLPPNATYTTSDVEAARHEMVSAISLIVESKPLASALSLGPFGAQVQPGQEYGGVYPPPFGPSSSSKFPCNDAATLACPLPLKRVERTSDTFEDHLTAWHLGRLEDFATSPYFKAIDILAFETIPLLRETKAIRRAVALFNKERSSVKPFYISHVYPLDKDGNARFPDPFQPTTASNESLVDLVVQASLALIASSETFETPSAVGFNCTNPLRALALVRQLAKSISSHSFACQPWLVVYPDGGAIYSTQTRTWSNPDGLSDEKWASILVEVVGVALNHVQLNGQPTFGGVLVGGCCKAGPGAIRELRENCKAAGLLG